MGLLAATHAFELLPQTVIHQRPASRSQWLWNRNASVAPNAVSYFRLAITIEEPVKQAFLNVFYDDKGEFFVNGKSVTGVRSAQGMRYDLGKVLDSGKNVLAIKLTNEAGPSGVLFYGRITLASGKVLSIHSDTSVKAASTVPSEQWKASDFDDSNWETALEQGDILTNPWASFLKLLDNYASPEEQAKITAERIAATTIPAGLKQEKEPVARIVYQGFIPKIEINGQAYAPVMNSAFNGAGIEPYDNIAIKTGRLGVRFFEVYIPDEQFYRADGNYDFNRLDFQARRILHLNPDAFLFVNFRFAAMAAWCKANPDEIVGYATGAASGSDELYGRPVRPSAASLKFKNEALQTIRAMMKFIQSQPWGKRVIGLRASYGIYREWHTYGMYQGPDTGKAMTAAFRNYLKNKYRSDAALRQAWNDNTVTIDSATVPTADERWSKPSFFRDPVANRKVLDYYDCNANVTADLLLAMGQCVKENLPGRLFGAYYGYALQHNQPPEGANVLLDKVLSSPFIDFLSNPAPYTADSRLAGGDFMERSIPATYHRYEKLVLAEDDSRFHHIVTQKAISCRDAVESEMVVRRNYCNMIFDGAGIQFNDPNSKDNRPHAFDDPAVLNGIRESMAAFEKIGTVPQESGNDLAVVFNYYERLRHESPHNSNSPLSAIINRNAVSLLNRSGYAFDLLSLTDFLASKRQYRAAVFVNPFTFTAAERAELKNKVRIADVTSIWCYAPGYVSDEGFSTAAMEDLTGIKLDADANGKDARMQFIQNGGTASFRSKGDGPRILVRDNKATAFAFYDPDQAVGAAEKTLPDKSRAIFLGVYPENGQQWARILKMAGAHNYTGAGSYFRRHGDLVMFHTGIAGKHTITLPEQFSFATELYSGKVFKSNPIILEASGPATWLIKINRN